MVFIETQFDEFNTELPAITICSDLGNISRQNNIKESFKKLISLKPIMDVWKSFEGSGTDITKEVAKYSVETINLRYYCYTINALLGKQIVGFFKTLHLIQHILNNYLQFTYFLLSFENKLFFHKCRKEFI